MSLAQRVLAGTFATAMAVAPSLAQEATKVAAKPASEPKIMQPESKPDVITLMDDYSENHPVVAIAILKGQKETLLTGEQIGDKLSEALTKIHGAYRQNTSLRRAATTPRSCLRSRATSTAPTG
jgi:hypothetical protein